MNKISLLFLLLVSISTVAATKQRIITLSPGTTEILYTIGAGDQIIATVEHSDYPLQAQKLPRVGNYHALNIETILAMQPDLIVVWSEGNPATQIEQLQQLDLPVYISHTSSLNGLADELRTLGKLTGNSEQAQKVADDYLKTLEELKHRYSQRQPVSLFYQVWPEPLMSASDSSWLGESFKLCGGQNIFADNSQPFPLVSAEEVILRQPQVIFAADQNKTVLARWQQWPELTAVKNQHLYTLEPDHLHRFGPRLTNGISRLCEILEKVRNEK